MNTNNTIPDHLLYSILGSYSDSKHNKFVQPYYPKADQDQPQNIPNFVLNHLTLSNN